MTAARIILQALLLWSVGIMIALAILESGRRDCVAAGNSHCTSSDLVVVKSVAWPITVYIELDRVLRGEEAP